MASARSLLGRSSRYNAESSPSMVQRTGDQLVVRSVVSGTSLNIPGFEEPSGSPEPEEDSPEEDEDLPQCKIKRNYTCARCSFFTQNPRTYLYHLRDEHKDRIKVYECPKCVYASKHSQKLQRHIHMVHVIGKQAKKLPVIKPPVAETSDMMDEEDSEDDGLVIEAGDELEESEDEVEEGEEGDVTSPLNSSVEEELKCSVCSFTSHSRTLVQRHENEMHLKKKFFRCTKCNYVTHMKARFTKHVKYHSMPMIKCDLCDFRTPYKWNLDRHYKNHQGDGEFKCPLCNFNADIKQSLTVHVQNHHLTPQQRLMRGMGRRNKVGASDAPAKELRMSDVGLVGAAGMQPPQSPPQISIAELHEQELSGEDEDMDIEEEPVPSTSRKQPKLKMTIKKVKKSPPSDRNHYGADFLHPDDILNKNGKIYYKNHKCSYCSYKAFWEGDVLRHESKAHGIENPRNKQSPKKRLARPIPNLIPLQQQTSPPPPSILRIPSIESRRSSTDGCEAMTEQDLNEIKSSNSALKDFASLIGAAFTGDEEAAKPVEEPPQEEAPKKEEEKPEKSASPLPPATGGKRKTTSSFFDKLKEKLIGQEASNLVCDRCGHESKCLSEALCHQKLHKDAPANQRSLSAMVGVSSTRCQHCRHRCKTSADLLVHLQSCLSRDSTSDGQEESKDGSDPKDESKSADKEEAETKLEVEEQEPPQCPNCEQRFDTEEDLNKHQDYCKPRLELNPEVSITEVVPQESHPMENKVFVWNQFAKEPSPEQIKPTLTIERIPSVAKKEAPAKSPEQSCEEDDEEEEEGPCLVGYELAPGYGSVAPQQSVLKSNDTISHMQKVFKCPKCNFWAGAASRFHIHLVGHLNRKPFGCSQCDYRSNWRWDVAKHIRLKGVRDPLHSPESRPRVLVHDDDSSRRNYSKYNKFLTLMSVRLGQVQSDSPPPATLPAPPKLIPAPNVPNPEVSLTRHQAGLRPPPPLRAATNQSLSQLSNEDSRQGVKRPADDANKPGEPPTKRLLWRCKKCNYRGVNKDEVLAHVRTHYQNLSAVQISPSTTVTVTNGHKERHAFKCDKCPYIARWQGELHTHQQHHVPHSGAIFKCYLCPYYVVTKGELLTHMKVHGVNEPEDYISKAMQAKLAASKQAAQDDNSGAESSTGKRYRCGSCPYESNARGQFLYHMQLHGGGEDTVTITCTKSAAASALQDENEVFRCHVCSYSVAKRHLLNQHLRVHGIVVPPSRVSASPPKTLTQLANVDFQKLKDVPLVWVKKQGKFLKMFKCRYCPHVNLRKINIQEHEKMHKVRKTQSPAEPDPSGMIHRCPHCSYVCNNAGVLSAHAKVHQDWYPRGCALVNILKTDEEQLKELGGEMADTADLEDGELDPMEGYGFSGSSEMINITPQLSITPASGPPEDEQEGDEEEDTRLLYFCKQCPARFLFSRELAIHRRFHRIRLQHQCPSCTYTARQPSHLQAHAKVHTQDYQDRTHLMLQQHQMSAEHFRPATQQKCDGQWVVVDEPSPHEPRRPTRAAMTISAVPLSGTELFQQREAQRQGDALTGDPVFGTLIHGNPKFVYPVYFKNGKVKEKRYKCHKCPSAFEKREQYKVHLSLHGSKQKYRCERCDYSVKYYANFIQHLRKHQHNDEMRRAAGHDPSDDVAPPTGGGVRTTAGKSISQAKSMPTAERQGLMLQQRRKEASDDAQSNDQISMVPSYWCPHCPYHSMRRDCVDTHAKRHLCNNPTVKSAFLCNHCDYSAPQSHFLREHNKLHFRYKPQPHGRRPESFIYCDKMELWAHAVDKENEAARRVFEDRGCEADERFSPPNSDSEPDEEDPERDVYIDLRSGQAQRAEDAPAEPAAAAPEEDSASEEPEDAAARDSA